MQMKSLKAKKLQNFIKLPKRFFAGGGGHDIDYNLKEFDVCFVGGLNAANVLKYMQHTQFPGTMVGFNPKQKFFNELHYEHLIHGSMQPFKYIAMAFNSNYDIKHAAFFPSRVTKIIPEKNQIVDDRGITFTYKALVLNTGLDQKVENMPFVDKYVNDGEFGKSRVFVHMPSDDFHIERNRRIYSMHKDNDFLLYIPEFPNRREAADAWYLALDTYFSWGIHSGGKPANTKVHVITPNNVLFKFPFANEVVMEEVSQRKTIELHFGYELVNIEIIEKGIHATHRYATFRHKKTGEEKRMIFGTLLLSPNNKKRACYESNDLTDEHGQVKVNPYTLQHVKYENIFAFGDCINANTTKSFYATLNQGVVLRNNLSDYLNGKEFKGIYEGYSSFAVQNTMDKQWIMSHKYNYKPSFGNFYVPRLLGLFVYRWKNLLEKQYFSKVFQGKLNYGYPWLSKNRYFRPIEENRYVRKNHIKREDIFIHKNTPPVLSFHHHHDTLEHIHDKSQHKVVAKGQH